MSLPEVWGIFLSARGWLQFFSSHKHLCLGFRLVVYREVARVHGVDGWGVSGFGEVFREMRDRWDSRVVWADH